MDEPRGVTDGPPLWRRAMGRSWVCPEAGFALVGRPWLAAATFTAVVGLLPATARVALDPGAAAAWTVAGVLAVAVVLSLAEQAAVVWSAPRPPGPRWLVAGYPAATALLWLAVVGALVAFFAGFGVMQLAGDGMAPTLVRGERFLYSRRVDPDRLGRGAVIVFHLSEQTAWGRAGLTNVGRILAGPGDRLAIRGGRYEVNGDPGPPAAETGALAPVVRVPFAPNALTVPADRFFVVQDDPAQGYDSRVLSWADRDRVVGNRLYYLSSRGWFRPVE